MGEEHDGLRGVPRQAPRCGRSEGVCAATMAKERRPRSAAAQAREGQRRERLHEKEHAPSAGGCEEMWRPRRDREAGVERGQRTGCPDPDLRRRAKKAASTKGSRSRATRRGRRRGALFEHPLGSSAHARGVLRRLGNGPGDRRSKRHVNEPDREPIDRSERTDACSLVRGDGAEPYTMRLDTARESSRPSRR